MITYDEMRRIREADYAQRDALLEWSIAALKDTYSDEARQRRAALDVARREFTATLDAVTDYATYESAP